jgi:hypothetical protein
MADEPPQKAWGQANKEYLQDLIDKGKVDITRTADLKYINQVRANTSLDATASTSVAISGLTQDRESSRTT